MERGRLTPTSVLLLATSLVLPSLSAAAAGAAPRGAGGKDVFGRTAACRACHALVRNLRGGLVPALDAAVERRRRSRSAAALGELEGLCQDAVPRGCAYAATYHDRELRRACDDLVESHEDALIAAYYAYAAEGANASVAEGDEYAWNRLVCGAATSACPPHLAARELQDFDDDGSGSGGDRVLRSEHAPAPAGAVDEFGVVRVVGASFHDVVIADDAYDALVYYAYPRTEETFHDNFLPTLRSLAELFVGNATGRDALRVASIDCDANDVPPPYGDGILKPSIAIYPVGAKTTPRFITQDAGGSLSLYDLLYLVLHAAGRAESRRTAFHFTRAVEYDLLYKTWDERHGGEL